MIPPEEGIRRLRDAAAGRREYAARTKPDDLTNPALRQSYETLLTQADTLDAAARIMEGDIEPLYGLLPSWRWTDDMEAALYLRNDIP